MESPISASRIKPSNHQNRNPNSPSPSPSPSPSRLWRPAAQKNIRNQWSNIFASKNRWFSSASEARSHATSLVNAHLSQRYLPAMDLGALKEMPGIRQKASEKLSFKQQSCCRSLLSSYKDMVAAVAHMVKFSSSMRCFLKKSGVTSLVQFCDNPEDDSDPGDGGGIPVFSLLSITYFENLAQELVDMFVLELNLKRLLVVELLNLKYEEGGGRANQLSWFDDLYPGEFDDLRMTNMLSEENNQPLPPRIKDWESGDPLTADQSDRARCSEVLQVYLTSWLADVNIDMHRLREIFSIVEDEIQVKLL